MSTSSDTPEAAEVGQASISPEASKINAVLRRREAQQLEGAQNTPSLLSGTPTTARSTPAIVPGPHVQTSSRGVGLRQGDIGKGNGADRQQVLLRGSTTQSRQKALPLRAAKPEKEAAWTRVSPAKTRSASNASTNSAPAARSVASSSWSPTEADAGEIASPGEQGDKPQAVAAGATLPQSFQLWEWAYLTGLVDDRKKAKIVEGQGLFVEALRKVNEEKEQDSKKFGVAIVGGFATGTALPSTRPTYALRGVFDSVKLVVKKKLLTKAHQAQLRAAQTDYLKSVHAKLVEVGQSIGKCHPKGTDWGMDAYFSIKLPSSGETLEVRLMGDATYDLEVVDQELRFRRENQHVDFLATMMGRTLKGKGLLDYRWGGLPSTVLTILAVAYRSTSESQSKQSDPELYLGMLDFYETFDLEKYVVGPAGTIADRAEEPFQPENRPDEDLRVGNPVRAEDDLCFNYTKFKEVQKHFKEVRKMIIEADLDVDTQETAPSYRLLALQSIIDNAVTIEVAEATAVQVTAHQAAVAVAVQGHLQRDLDDAGQALAAAQPGKAMKRAQGRHKVASKDVAKSKEKVILTQTQAEEATAAQAATAEMATASRAATAVATPPDATEATPADAASKQAQSSSQRAKERKKMRESDPHFEPKVPNLKFGGSKK